MWTVFDWLLSRGRRDDQNLARVLRAHVNMLATTIGERNVGNPSALADAARFIRTTWERAGYKVKTTGYEVDSVTCHNLEVEVRGETPDLVLIGAHYDSVVGSPGANDNGSGVAVLLEAAARLRRCRPRLTLRFVAFVNEEPPWFDTPDMGSRVYAAAARARQEHILGMLALETVGYFQDTPGSQSYPPGLGLLYPDRGNFLAVVGDIASQRLVTQVAEALQASRTIPVEALSAFASTPGVGWSDHSSFWTEGYPAVMLTDTAPYRYPFYHTADDTADRVDYPRLAAVTRGVVEVARHLSQAQQG